MKKINLKERISVFGTGKSAFLPKGKEISTHPINAEYLVKTGKASYDIKSSEK